MINHLERLSFSRNNAVNMIMLPIANLKVGAYCRGYHFFIIHIEVIYNKSRRHSQIQFYPGTYYVGIVIFMKHKAGSLLRLFRGIVIPRKMTFYPF